MAMISMAEFFSQLNETKLPIFTDNKNINWYNVPASFDIETSSFYQDNIKSPENKRAIMYIWMFGIGDFVTYGRTWKEFKSFLAVLSTDLGLEKNCRLPIYVHNLQYEWQFIRKHFDWDEVFFLDQRQPVRARFGGIEFRCSLKLSGGKSLANVAKDLQYHKIEKKVGDLDYNLIRTPITPLTEKELGYCEYDIRCVNAYIEEKIAQDGNVTRIPMTNTGYVREYCRKACFRQMAEIQKNYEGIDFGYEGLREEDIHGD